MSALTDRRRFVAASLALAAGSACRPAPRPEPRSAMTNAPSATSRQPVLFLGHGSPMNAIEDNRWSRAFRALGKELPRPRAILSVSAHWFVGGSFVTSAEHPE